MTETKKESKREDNIAKLKELGIDTKGLSDDELLFKAVTELNKINSRLATTIATAEMEDYKKYSQSIDHKIKDKDLIIRLMKLNVPNFYLHLFRDEDKEKTDKDLWLIVSKSRINPFSTPQDIFKQRDTFNPVKPKRLYSE